MVINEKWKFISLHAYPVVVIGAGVSGSLSSLRLLTCQMMAMAGWFMSLLLCQTWSSLHLLACQVVAIDRWWLMSLLLCQTSSSLCLCACQAVVIDSWWFMSLCLRACQAVVIDRWLVSLLLTFFICAISVQFCQPPFGLWCVLGHWHHRSKPGDVDAGSGSPVPNPAAVPAQSHHGLHWHPAQHRYQTGKSNLMLVVSIRWLRVTS